MDREMILKHFKRGEKPRRLTKHEIEDYCNIIVYPFDNFVESKEIIHSHVRHKIAIQLSKVTMYPSVIPVCMDLFRRNFLRSLELPGVAFGSRTAESLSGQAMQDLLNSFHATGSAKPGGIQAIKENITVGEREKEWMLISFKNTRLTSKEVLELQKEFVGVNVKTLCTRIYTRFININDHLEYKKPKTIKEMMTMANEEKYWWFKYGHYDRIYNEERRTCIVFEIDKIKLTSLKMTTTDIANKISSVYYNISIGKAKSGDQDKQRYRIVCLPSPSFIGIIHGFLVSSNEAEPSDVKKDYFLQQSILNDDFSSILVSGYDKINNFYPMTKSLFSYITAVLPAFTEVKENGVTKKVPKGTWVYLSKDIRFTPVPIRRITSMFESAGIKCLEDDEAYPFDNLEFNAHKINKERRKRLLIQATVLNEKYIGRNYKNGEETVEYKETLFQETSKRTFGDVERIFFVSTRPTKEITKKLKIGFKSKKSMDRNIEKIMNKDEKIINDIFPDKEFVCVELSYEDDDENDVFTYVTMIKVRSMTVEITVNLKELNNPNNYTSLDNAIINTYSIKKLTIPSKHRLPRILKVLEEVSRKSEFKKNAILLDTFLPFREDVNNDLQTKKKTRLEILKDFVTLNTTQDEMEYTYVETKGSDLTAICCNPLVNPMKTTCNNFSQTHTLLGLEALRNLINYDLGSVLNSSSYINYKYPSLVANVVTNNGINKFTSTGIGNQNSGPIATMAFDNVKVNAIKFSGRGQFFSLDTASTSVMVGRTMPLGTGYVKVDIDNANLAPTSTIVETDSMILINKGINYSEDTINIMPFKISGELFPPNPYIVSKYITKTISFYLGIVAEKFKNPVIQPIINNISETVKLFSEVFVKPIIVNKK